MVKRLRFFDIKAKEFFSTSNFKVVKRGKRLFAVANSTKSKTRGKPTVIWRTLPKDFKK